MLLSADGVLSLSTIATKITKLTEKVVHERESLNSTKTDTEYIYWERKAV